MTNTEQLTEIYAHKLFIRILLELQNEFMNIDNLTVNGEIL